MEVLLEAKNIKKHFPVKQKLFSKEPGKAVKAHEHGIRCNVFYADDPEEAKQYLDMGIDTILTNNYRVIAETVRGCKK